MCGQARYHGINSAIAKQDHPPWLGDNAGSGSAARSAPEDINTTPCPRRVRQLMLAPDSSAGVNLHTALPGGATCSICARWNRPSRIYKDRLSAAALPLQRPSAFMEWATRPGNTSRWPSQNHRLRRLAGKRQRRPPQSEAFASAIAPDPHLAAGDHPSPYPPWRRGSEGCPGLPARRGNVPPAGLTSATVLESGGEGSDRIR